MRRGWLLLVLVVAGCGAGDEVGGPVTTGAPDLYADYLASAEGREFITEIRADEALVVGDVFTKLMSNPDLVAAGLAMCESAENPLADAAEVLVRYDWNMPANSALAETIHGSAESWICSAGLPALGLPLEAVLPPRPQNGDGGGIGDVEATVQAFINSDAGQEFLAKIRGAEVELSPVFTETLSDRDLVGFARGICSTNAELGEAAGDELRLHREDYGWTTVADDAMFDLLLENVEPVCLTVGS